MLKNILVLLVLFFLYTPNTVISSGTLVVDECYTNWLSDFEGATHTYQSDTQACAGVWMGNDMCQEEVEIIYTQAINTAGETFHCCVQGC